MKAVDKPIIRIVAGVSLNTSRMSESEAQVIQRNTAQSMGLLCVDPIPTGVESIVSALETVDAP